MGGCAGEVVPEDFTAGGAGAWARGCSAGAAEADLAVPLCSEGGEAAGAAGGGSGDAGACGDAGNSAQEPSGGRGCNAFDVTGRRRGFAAAKDGHKSFAATQDSDFRFVRERTAFQACGDGLVKEVEFLAWLEADGFARGDGDFRAGAGVAADSGFAGLDGEDAKATEFNAVSANEALLHAVEDGVDSGFGFDSR